MVVAVIIVFVCVSFLCCCFWLIVCYCVCFDVVGFKNNNNIELNILLYSWTCSPAKMHRWYCFHTSPQYFAGVVEGMPWIANHTDLSHIYLFGIKYNVNFGNSELWLAVSHTFMKIQLIIILYIFTYYSYEYEYAYVCFNSQEQDWRLKAQNGQVTDRKICERVQCLKASTVRSLGVPSSNSLCPCQTQASSKIYLMIWPSLRNSRDSWFLIELSLRPPNRHTWVSRC